MGSIYAYNAVLPLCRDEIFNVVEHKGYCPNCGSFSKTVLSGKEFSVREIIVPEKTSE